MAIYKTAIRHGQRVQVKLKPAEIKKTIMQANGWTEDEYRKKYDIFKNKLRAYENYRKAGGAKVKEQSPIEVLYRQARAKQRYGVNYQPTQEMRRIEKFGAYSITKGKQLAENEGYRKRLENKQLDYINTRFGGFLRANTKANEIYNAMIAKGADPVAIENALSDYANLIHEKIDESKAEDEEGGIPSGETYGSDDVDFDFDYNVYL